MLDIEMAASSLPVVVIESYIVAVVVVSSLSKKVYLLGRVPSENQTSKYPSVHPFLPFLPNPPRAPTPTPKARQLHHPNSRAHLPNGLPACLPA